MTARHPLPHPPVPGLDPDAAARLGAALVKRRTDAYEHGRHDPCLTVWAYGAGTVTPLGRWAARPRVAARLDAWLRDEIVRRLLGPYEDALTRPLAVWERTGALSPRAEDRAWHAAWRVHAPPSQPFLVVTHAGWLSLPDGTTCRVTRARAGRA